MTHATISPDGLAVPTGAPKVAVVIPTFKHSSIVVEAIESAFGQIAPFPIHIVMVNDGCPFEETDAVGRDYARAYPDTFTYLRKANGGLSDARNFGIRHVLAHLPSVQAVYLMDADNRLRPKALARAMAKLESDAELGWIYPNIDMFGLSQAVDFGGSYSPLLHSALNVCEAGSLIHRRVFEAGVLFDTSFKQGFEDWDFFLSAHEAGFKAANIEEFGFLYRKRPESMLASAEREGDAIKQQMRDKHKAQFSAKNMIVQEHETAPRYAVMLTDTREVMFTTDPSLETERMSFDEFTSRVWLAYANPSRNRIPPQIFITTSAVLKTLKDSKCLHWCFWELENAAMKRGGIASLTLKGMSQDRMSMDIQHPSEGRHLKSCGFMLTSQLLNAVLADPQTIWVDSLAKEQCSPAISILEITLPEDVLKNAKLPEQVQTALSIIHEIRDDDAREAGTTQWDWREGGIGARGQEHSILRGLFESAPAYPKLPSAGKNIGIILPIVEFGGVEKVGLNVARALKAHGYTPHLIVVGSKDAGLSRVWRDTFETISFFAPDEFDLWNGGNKSYLGTHIAGWAEKGPHGPALAMMYWLDVVINMHGGSIAGMMGKLKKFGVTTVNSLHLADLTPTGRETGNTHLGLAFEHAFDFFAPCSETLGDWCRGLSVPTSKVVPVVNAPGFELTPAQVSESLAARQRKMSQTDRPLRVAFLGRLDAQKGLHRLSRVIEQTRDLNVYYRVIGKAVVPSKEAVLPSVLEECLEPPILEPEDLRALYDWADVLLLLSEFEGLPLTILEAMRQGVVPIATNVGAVSEVLSDQKNGVLLDLKNAAFGAIAAIKALEKDRDHLANLSNRAAADMAERTWYKAVGPLVQALERP